MFKICVIGCGAMAKSGHGPAFKKYAQEYNDTLLAGCCDIKREAAEEFAATFGFSRAYTDYRVMLDEVKPDVVSLLSPVELTSELAVSVLKLGYPLILEKPPGRNREEILAIDRAAREAGVSVRTAFNRRYTPLVQKLKELLADEKIMNITYQMYRRGRSEPDFSTTSIHAIDAVSFVGGGKYKNVSITSRSFPRMAKTWQIITSQASLTAALSCRFRLSRWAEASRREFPSIRIRRPTSLSFLSGKIVIAPARLHALRGWKSPIKFRVGAL